MRQIDEDGRVEEFLAEIAAGLKDGTYWPAPVRRRLIPKPGGIDGGGAGPARTRLIRYVPIPDRAGWSTGPEHHGGWCSQRRER